MLGLACVQGYAQTCDYSISGRIIDRHDDSLLTGATLVLLNTGETVYSDLDGIYEFTGLCEGTLNIRVSHPLCEPSNVTISVPSNVPIDFYLEHHYEELGQVTVTGNAYATQSESLLENRVKLSTLEQFAAGSIGDALNTLSGVSSLNTGNTVVKPMINGLHSSRVTIIQNGVRMQDQEWGAEHAPNIDLNTAGQVIVLKGASALQYSGDAIGGVVISEPPRVPVKDSLFGKVILNGATNGRGGSITSTITKTYKSGLYATLQGTVKRFGDFEAPDYVLSNTGVFERDGSIRIGIKDFDYGLEGYYSYFRNDIGILRASHIGGAQDQVAAINSQQPLIIEDFTYDIGVPRQEVTHHLAQVSAFKRIENLGKVSASYNYQFNRRFEYDIRRGDDAEKPAVDLELSTHQISVDLESDLSERVSVKTGVAFNYQNNFANPETGVRRLIPDYDQYRWSVFGISDIELNSNLFLELGARFDYTTMDVLKFYRTSFWELRGYDELFPELEVETFGNQILTNPKPDFANASATAGLNYQFGNGLILYGNYSLATRAPNPSELFSEGLHHSASRIELGDLKFSSEISNKFAVTLQKNEGIFQFTLNPFVHFIDNFILIEPTRVEQTIRGNFQVWEYRQTEANLLGVDVDLRTEITDQFTLTNQFSYVWGQDTTLDIPLINMPPPSMVNALEYNVPKFHGLNLKLQSDYFWKQSRFPDNNFEVFLAETETNELVDVSTPPDAYHLISFMAQMEFPFNNSNNKITVGCVVSNMFNTSYRNYLNRLRYYADDLGRNVGLNIKVNF